MPPPPLNEPLLIYHVFGMKIMSSGKRTKIKKEHVRKKLWLHPMENKEKLLTVVTLPEPIFVNTGVLQDG